ncbi:MAG: CAP domain-containing protein, partial [Rhizomicrobium sp.]
PFTAKQKIELLAAHNKYRSQVGDQALTWSDDLAASAQIWAQHLAKDVHALKHSGALAKGENLAMWTAGRASLTQLVDLWGAEKHYFVESSFPNVSTTGDWKTVAHYTQMIWRNTTEVGCGLATGGGDDYLVCQYAPQGNFMGQKVF